MQVIVLMKKMSEAKKLKPGPKRKLNDSARKRNKKAENAKLNKNRIYIGDEYDRWMEIKTAHTEIYSQMASGRPLISNPDNAVKRHLQRFRS
jgi:hypothetical protein